MGSSFPILLWKNSCIITSPITVCKYLLHGNQLLWLEEKCLLFFLFFNFVEAASVTMRSSTELPLLITRFSQLWKKKKKPWKCSNLISFLTQAVIYIIYFFFPIFFWIVGSRLLMPTVWESSRRRRAVAGNSTGAARPGWNKNTCESSGS